jgi:prevent-host-death family protein
MQKRSSDNLRRHARDILDDVEQHGESFVIERWRRPVAVVISIDEWRELEKLRGEQGDV